MRFDVVLACTWVMLPHMTRTIAACPPPPPPPHPADDADLVLELLHRAPPADGVSSGIGLDLALRSPTEPPHDRHKHDEGKRRWDLLAMNAIGKIADVRAFGVAKYTDPEGWRQVPNALSRYLAAAYRHIVAYHGGGANDPESGLPHLAHAMCNLMFLSELEDSPKKEPVVWADDSAPFTGAQVKDLLDENERIRASCDAYLTNLTSTQRRCTELLEELRQLRDGG